MKIPRANVRGSKFERHDALRLHVNHSALVLQRAFDAQKAAARGRGAMLLEEIRRLRPAGPYLFRPLAEI